MRTGFFLAIVKILFMLLSGSTTLYNLPKVFCSIMWNYFFTNRVITHASLCINILLDVMWNLHEVLMEFFLINFDKSIQNSH